MQVDGQQGTQLSRKRMEKSQEVRRKWELDGGSTSTVLNVPSKVDQDVVGQMPSWPTAWELNRPPSEEEMLQALGKLRKGKAGGKSGILPELLACGGAEMCDRLLMVMKDMWEEGRVVDDWRNAEIVPIPKKGHVIWSVTTGEVLAY